MLDAFAGVLPCTVALAEAFMCPVPIGTILGGAPAQPTLSVGIYWNPPTETCSGFDTLDNVLLMPN